MQVKQAIKLLSEMDPDEEICISWWEHNLFTMSDDETVVPATSTEWLNAVADFDANGGYDDVNQQVWMNLYYEIRGEGEF